MVRKLRTRAQDALRQLGPGLITGAADDDPSGIATYSQAGAQFGFNMLWSVFFTWPLMVSIQMVSARIGMVTGRGLAANLHRAGPRWLLLAIVGMLLFANTINVAADIAAMGEALQLLIGGPQHGYSLVFGVVCLLLQVYLPYKSYVRVLKWLTLALLVYVLVLLTVHVPWHQVMWHTLVPTLHFSKDYLVLLVAVLGTTISPYLFFWQAAQEAEDLQAIGLGSGLDLAHRVAKSHLRRIRFDTIAGMGFSNLIAFFIMLTTAVTLHSHGITDIQTSAQAAEALRPVAGQLTFALFAAGIIGTGMLAVPVLAGSAAYAVSEAFDWEAGLDRKLGQARKFYGIIALATLGGLVVDFAPVDPIRALFWSAVINGVIAVPIMAVMMVLGSRRDLMGAYVIGRRLRALGWLSTLVMFAAVVAMVVTA
jgi:Mn2+/Fe2+ NRAMP family transporter